MTDFSDDFTACARKMPRNSFTKVDDACLLYKNTNDMRDLERYYDFLSRTVTVRGTRDSQTHIIHFRDCDAESLSFMRQKLVELGGTPPALAKASASAKPAAGA